MIPSIWSPPRAVNRYGSSSISFIIEDFMGVDSYWINTSIDSYWEVSGNVYTLFLNDSVISEGLKNIKLFCNDTQGYTSELSLKLIFDKTLPGFSDVSTNGNIISDILEINATITDLSELRPPLQVDIQKGIFMV